MSEIQSVTFDRRPYKVEYYKDGKKQTLVRRPPPKLHDVLPGDTVTIRNRKNADWREDDEVSVKAINPRQPNVLQVSKPNGEYTFLSYFDCDAKPRANDEMYRDSSGKLVRDPVGNDYLLWP